MATSAGAQILAPILHGVATSALRSAPPAPHNPGANSQISPTDWPLTPGFPNQPVGSDTLITTEANGGSVPLSGLEIKQDSENWLFDFKVWQKFAVNVKPAAGDRRLGHAVGLVQTLLSSTRRITYAGGGAGFIPGGQPPQGQNGNVNGPWLDADQTNLKQHPWYRDTCEGKVMKADQMETYVMEDNPTFKYVFSEPYLPTSYRSPSCDVTSGAVSSLFAPWNNGKTDSSFCMQRTDSRIRQNKDKARSHRRLCERSLLNQSL